MIDDLTLKRWENEYIEDLDLKEKTYLLYNTVGMRAFINENYFDSESNRFVTGKSDVMLIGLQYLDYGCELIDDDNTKYLICITKNKKGKYTILSELIYHEDCMSVVSDQVIPVTLVEYAEVNSYYRKLGLNTELLSVFANIVDTDKMILGTAQSLMGHKCHVFDSLKLLLYKNGFKEDIRLFNQMDENYINVLKGKEKQLKKTI